MFNRLVTGLAKASPTLLLIAGSVGIVATAIATYKKGPAIVEACEEFTNQMEVYQEDVETNSRPDVKKLGLSVVRKAAVPVALGLVTVGLFITSNILAVRFERKVLMTHIAGLSAGYAALTQEHSQYRDIVTKKYGKKVENDINVMSKLVPVDRENLVEGDKIYMIEDQTFKHKNGTTFTHGLLSESYYDPMGVDPDVVLNTFYNKHIKLTRMMEERGFLLLVDVLDTFGLPRFKGCMDWGWEPGDKFDLDIRAIHSTEWMGIDYGEEYFLDDYMVTWTPPTEKWETIPVDAVFN